MAKSKKVVKTVTIPEELRDMVQRAHLEYFQKDRVIRGMIEDHQYDEDSTQFLESDVFKAYEDKTAKALLAYDTISNKMAKDYLPDEFKGMDNYQWSLDYNTCELSYKSL